MSERLDRIHAEINRQIAVQREINEGLVSFNKSLSANDSRPDSNTYLRISQLTEQNAEAISRLEKSVEKLNSRIDGLSQGGNA